MSFYPFVLWTFPLEREKALLLTPSKLASLVARWMKASFPLRESGDSR